MVSSQQTHPAAKPHRDGRHVLSGSIVLVEVEELKTPFLSLQLSGKLSSEKCPDVSANERSLEEKMWLCLSRQNLRTEDLVQPSADHLFLRNGLDHQNNPWCLNRKAWWGPTSNDCVFAHTWCKACGICDSGSFANLCVHGDKQEVRHKDALEPNDRVGCNSA